MDDNTKNMHYVLNTRGHYESFPELVSAAHYQTYAEHLKTQQSEEFQSMRLLLQLEQCYL